MAEMAIMVDGVRLSGILTVPKEAKGLVLFAHGSGSGRLSPRNNYVARVLNEAGLATLLMDLLTEEEDAINENRFDIDLLTERLKEVTKWGTSQGGTKGLHFGYFGGSTGTAAALRAAAALPGIKAVVSRGGRPDLVSDEELMKVTAPTLLIVGGNDAEVITMNESAYKKLGGVHKMEIISGATHLFEEPGKLEKVAQMAVDWFGKYLA